MSARTALVLLGFATALAQAVLVREGMAAVAGSELAWGSVLGLWLVAMGVGSRAGVALGATVPARTLPAAVLGLCATGVVLLRTAPALSGGAPGETLTSAAGCWIWALAIVPAGLAGGLAFPALAAVLDRGGSGRAYALEAGGALVGGVAFTFALARLGSAATVLLGLGLVVAASLGWRRRALALLALAAAVAGAIVAGPVLARAGWRWAGRPGTLGSFQETRHQYLAVSAESPRALYGNGRLLASYPDPYATSPRAHLVMLLHPAPNHVLAVGALADGTIEHLLAHPVERLELAEEDPALPALLADWYGPALARALADPRVHARAVDPARALLEHDAWQLVLLLDGDPASLRQNRTRTLELLAACHDRMARDGVLVLRVGVGDTYLGGAAGRLVAVLAATLQRVFPKVSALPGEQILLVAGREDAQLVTDPATLVERWRSRHIEGSDFDPRMLRLLLDPGRQRELQSFTATPGDDINTADRPRAVLLAAALAEGRGDTSVLRLLQAMEARPPMPLAALLGLAVVALIGLAATRRGSGPATALVVGLASMGWFLLLIGVWQATRGSVYSEIGALSAAFMVGLVGGAAAAQRWPQPSRRLPAVLAAGAALSALLATGLAPTSPGLAVPVLLATGGALTGAAFAGVAALSGGTDTRRGAGIGFAADEVGAAAGALLVGLVALPWAGRPATALGLGILQLAAIPMVLVALRHARHSQ